MAFQGWPTSVVKSDFIIFFCETAVSRGPVVAQTSPVSLFYPFHHHPANKGREEARLGAEVSLFISVTRGPVTPILS